MKCEYKKPIIVIEDFKVNEFIAGACADANKTVVSFHGVANQCELQDDGGFTYYSGYCAKPPFGFDVDAPNSTDPNVKVCYHAPFELYFQS